MRDTSGLSKNIPFLFGMSYARIALISCSHMIRLGGTPWLQCLARMQTHHGAAEHGVLLPSEHHELAIGLHCVEYLFAALALCLRRSVK